MAGKNANAIDALFDEKAEAGPAPPKGDEGKPRDEHGRFAAKVEEAPPKADTPAVSPPNPDPPKPPEAPVVVAPPAPVPAAPVTAPAPEPAEAPVVVAPPAPVPAAPVTAPAPEPAKIEPGHVPIASLLDEREKRQRLERELEAFRSKQQPPQIPSIQDDPQAWAEHQNREFERRLLEERINTSEVYAREKHGNETVDAAIKWGFEQLGSVRGFYEQQISQKHPIDWLVRQFKHEKLLKDIGDDPDAYVRKRWSELNPAQPDIPQPVQPAASAPAAQPQPVPQPKPPPPRPSPSILHAPSAGGVQSVPSGPGAAFDAAIPR